MCWVAASTDTGEKIEDDRRFAEQAAAATEEGKGIVIAPLMHGAAQWGTFGSLFNGKTLVLMPKFDATRCGRRSRSIASPD